MNKTISLLLSAAVTVSASHALAQTAPAVESSRADEGEVEEKSITPVDEGSRGLWYKPSPDEVRPPTRTEYIPFAILAEPQALTGGARGGTLGTVQVDIPFAPTAGLVGGAQFSDAVRLIAGFDFFRYTGKELPFSKSAGTTIGAIFAPTIGVQGFIGGKAVGGDFWLAPIGLRGLVQAMHSLIELRAAGHLYYGTEVDSFGGGDSTLSRGSFAGSLGLQLTVAPLFAKRTVPISDEAREEPTARRSAPLPHEEAGDEEESEPKPKPKKKKKPVDEDARLEVPVTWGGVQ